MRTSTFITSLLTVSSGLLSLAAAAPHAILNKKDGHGKAPHYEDPKNGAHEGPIFTHTGLLFEFTSTYSIYATPDNVVDANNTRVQGEPGGLGFFHYGINSYENVICYNITLLGVRGEFKSPALTATHIHEAEIGLSGPPRIAFPNPVGDDYRRNSIGCIQGPFTTGIKNPEGKDTGEGFHVSQIEAHPRGFMTDTHTELFPAGAIRGQVERDLNGLRFAW